jgi:hypothetical protein
VPPDTPRHVLWPPLHPAAPPPRIAAD